MLTTVALLVQYSTMNTATANVHAPDVAIDAEVCAPLPSAPALTMKDLIEAHCVAEARFVAACEIQSVNMKQMFGALVIARNALLVRPPMSEEEAVMKRTHIATSDDLADDEFTTAGVGDLIARLCEYRPGA